MGKKRGPMPRIRYGDKEYTLWSKKTVVPNFDELDPISVYVWLCAHTRPRGYYKEENPLTGMGGAVSVK